MASCPSGGGHGSFAEVGDGTLDFAAIFAAAEEGGARWYIVEHHQPAMPALESA
jgi:sugar phosphate isomerase/epimerase